MYIHFRYMNDRLVPWSSGDGNESIPNLRGGMTISLDRGAYAIGVSSCSQKDAFVKRTGRRIADGRIQSARNPLHLEVEGDTFAVYAPKSIANRDLELIKRVVSRGKR